MRALFFNSLVFLVRFGFVACSSFVLFWLQLSIPGRSGVEMPGEICPLVAAELERKAFAAPACSMARAQPLAWQTLVVGQGHWPGLSFKASY